MIEREAIAATRLNKPSKAKRAALTCGFIGILGAGEGVLLVLLLTTAGKEGMLVSIALAIPNAVVVIGGVSLASRILAEEFWGGVHI